MTDSLMNAAKIGEKLRKLRGDKSMQSVAEEIGISTSALNMYELGERIPRDEIKIRLCRYYGVDIGIFYA